MERKKAKKNRFLSLSEIKSISAQIGYLHLSRIKKIFGKIYSGVINFTVYLYLGETEIHEIPFKKKKA